MKTILLIFLRNLAIMLGLLTALGGIVASVVLPMMWIGRTYAESPHLGLYLTTFTVLWIVVFAAAILSILDCD